MLQQPQHSRLLDRRGWCITCAARITDGTSLLLLLLLLLLLGLLRRQVCRCRCGPCLPWACSGGARHALQAFRSQIFWKVLHMHPGRLLIHFNLQSMQGG